MRDIDTELVKKVQHGNRDAFKEIYDISSPFVYSLCLNILNAKVHAQDATQEIFIKVFKTIRSFNFKSSFRTWLYRVAVNTALTMAKKIGREASTTTDFDNAVETISDDKKIDQSLLVQENKNQVESLLKNLTADQRACIILREAEQMNYKDIADALQININTVRSRIKRARMKLIACGKQEVMTHGL